MALPNRGHAFLRMLEGMPSCPGVLFFGWLTARLASGSLIGGKGREEAWLSGGLGTMSTAPGSFWSRARNRKSALAAGATCVEFPSLRGAIGKLPSVLFHLTARKTSLDSLRLSRTSRQYCHLLRQTVCLKALLVCFLSSSEDKEERETWRRVLTAAEHSGFHQQCPLGRG